MISHKIIIIILLEIYTGTIYSVKILQIKNGNNNFCSNVASIPSWKPYENILKLVNMTEPDLVIYASNVSESSDVLYAKLKTKSINIHKVYGTIDNSCELSRKNCFQSLSLNNTNLIFIIINIVQLRNNSVNYVEWLTSKLKKVRSNRSKAVIISYNSPGNLEFKNVTNDRMLLNTFMNFRKIIKGFIFYGELFDSIRIFLHNSKPVDSFGYAPYLNSISSNKASARLYDFNAVSPLFKFVDFKLTEKPNNQYKWVKNPSTILNSHMNGLYEFTQSLNKTVLSLNSSSNLERYCKISGKWIPNNCIFNCTQLSNACTILFRMKHEIQICINSCNFKILKNCNNVLLFSDIYFISSNVKINNDNSTTLSSIGNNGAIFFAAVIGGFVIILVGIVLAVNKVYCVRKTRQRSIFLSPLTIEVHVDSDNNNTNNNHQSSLDSINRTIDVKNNDEKPDTFNNDSNDSDNDHLKKSNGFSTNNHNNHDYRRM